MLVTKLLAFALLLHVLVGGAFSACCPSCGTQSISRLDLAQQRQIEENRAFIEELEANPDLLYSRDCQREVVTLTSRQQYELMRNFPGMFLTEEEYNQTANGLGTITTPNVTHVRPPRAASTLERVCKPKDQPEPFILVRNTRGEVVQLANTGNHNQWIFTETCESSASPAPGQKCGLAERHIPAVFINLRGSFDFDFAQVIIQCCVTVTW